MSKILFFLSCFLATGVLLTNNVTKEALGVESTLQVHSIDGIEVVNNNITINETEFWRLYDEQDNLIELMEYSMDPSSTLTVSFIDQLDIIRCKETLISKQTAITDITISIIPLFVKGDIETTSDTAVVWSKEDNAFVRDDNLDNYEYGLCVNEEGSTKGVNFVASMNVAIDELTRYGEFQINVSESVTKEIRLVFRMYDDDQFILFTDFRNNSYYYGESEHIVITDYASEYMNITVVSYDGSVSFIKDDELINTLTIKDLNGGLLVGGGSIKGLVNHVNISFDEEEIESVYALYNYSRPKIGVATTLIGKGTPKNFIVNNEEIKVIGRGINARSFASLTSKDLPINSNRFIVKGILKTKNTGSVENGKAGKVEFQIYQNTEKFMKFYVYRYVNKGTDYNNSFYIQGTNSLKNEDFPLACIKNNCFPLGAGEEHYFATRFEFIFDCGDIYVFFDNELYYQYSSGWGTSGFAIGMTEYADVSWTNMFFIEENAVINNRLRTLSPFKEDHTFGVSAITGNGDANAFINDGSNKYVKEDKSFTKSFIYDENKNPVKGNEYYLAGNIRIENHDSYAQGELLIEFSETRAYRFCLEFCPSGYYQVFTEHKNGGTYSNYQKVVKEKEENQNNIDFGVLIFNNNLYFLINGYVRFKYLNIFQSESHIAIGGKGGTVKVDDLSSELVHSNLSNIYANLEEYVEKSIYEKRIVQYENKYKDYEDGGLLLLGSSSLDYWKTYEEDLKGINLPIYNCGIGGTCVVDWHTFMMERLVYKHSPSKILFFLGGNGLAYYSPGQIGQQIEAILLDIHTNLPNAHIYILEQKPAIRPNKTLTQYHQINTLQKNIVDKYPTYLTYIENWDNYYREDGVINRSYFVDDGMHLNEEGYKIWTANVRKGLGLD